MQPTQARHLVQAPLLVTVLVCGYRLRRHTCCRTAAGVGQCAPPSLPLPFARTVSVGESGVRRRFIFGDGVSDS
eukprot:1256604-Pleurochrysis_carterae.AAC.1